MIEAFTNNQLKVMQNGIHFKSKKSHY